MYCFYLALSQNKLLKEKEKKYVFKTLTKIMKPLGKLAHRVYI